MRGEGVGVHADLPQLLAGRGFVGGRPQQVQCVQIGLPAVPREARGPGQQLLRLFGHQLRDVDPARAGPGVAGTEEAREVLVERATCRSEERRHS